MSTAVVDQAAFWRKEVGLCAKDRMYGCAASALAQLIAVDPSADTPQARHQITQYRAMGDVAMSDTFAQRAEAAVNEGRRRRERRFAALTRRASTRGLSEAEDAELVALAAALDR